MWYGFRPAAGTGNRQPSPKWLRSVWSSVLEVRRVVRDERIEGIVAFFSIPSGPAAWWAHRATGVPYIVSLRGGDVPGAEAGLGSVHRFLTPFRRCILRSARSVVANSPGLQTLAEKADPGPVRLIPNGVDTEHFSPAAAPPRTDRVPPSALRRTIPGAKEPFLDARAAGGVQADFTCGLQPRPCRRWSGTPRPGQAGQIPWPRPTWSAFTVGKTVASCGIGIVRPTL